MKIDAKKENDRLGRGLDDLLGPGLKTSEVLFVSRDRIVPDPHQPRKSFSQNELKDLADSIRHHGILQPLLVRAKGDNYEIIAGERRWRASKLADLKTLPVILKNPKGFEKEYWALLENLQRVDLSPIEEARAYQTLLEKTHLSTQELASYLGKARSSLINQLRLLKLPAELQEMLEKGLINVSLAKELLSIENPKKQKALAKEAVDKKWTLRDFNKKGSLKKSASSKKPQASWLKKMEKDLRENFLQKIRLDFNNGKGKMTFYFDSSQQLEEVVKKLCQKKL